jgi:hypothetical protein
MALFSIPFATSATTGAAQVQVHQPKPQVIKTISAQDKTSFISSLDSSAAFLPVSGSEPAQSPCVITFQILIFVGESELNNACASVLIEINSTQSSQASIILLTAFCQPQPTQTTLILATGEIESLILTSSGQVFVTFHDNKSLNLSSLFVIM